MLLCDYHHSNLKKIYCASVTTNESEGTEIENQ